MIIGVNMKTAVVVLVGFLIIAMLSAVSTSFSDNGILIGYGDHIELVCEENGLVRVTHTILETANVTENVTSTSTYSIEGTIVGNLTVKYDPEIREPNVRHWSKNGNTTIFVNFSVVLAPLKFCKLTLQYELAGILKNENGTLHLRCNFNTAAISSPEIVVKIPKPPPLHKLIVENTVPSPNVFIEESNYYDLVYNVPLFKFGNISTTSIDISYEIVLDFDAVIWWLSLAIASCALVYPLKQIGKLIEKQIRRGRHEKQTENEV